MSVEEIEKKISSAFSLEQFAPTTWKIKSSASFINGKAIEIYLENQNNNWILHDNKETIKYMNELYELKSNDVKMCISNIIKIYGFNINSGRLTAPLENIDSVMDKYFDFIMCVAQLSNMFAFFDKP